MKRLIFIALALILALGIVLVPSVAAEPTYPPEGNYPVKISKTIPLGGPIETFTFWGWRDMNNNGQFDDGDYDLGTLKIEGAGTGTLYSPYLGICIVHEILGAGSAYIQQPDQLVQANCDTARFENKLKEKGKLIIEKVDELGNPLAGACFNITPDPKTGTGILAVCDNDGLNDEDPRNGILLVTGCIIGTVCTVEETVVPPGCPDCVLAPPQTVTISAEVTLTFRNYRPTGDLTILKQDGSGNALAGATFEICPNPKTGELPCLNVTDEGENDEAPGQPGVLAVTGCIIGLECTVAETVAPTGYEPAPPQTVTISALVEVPFVNERCGLVIKKVDAAGNALGGACFNITPDPKTGIGVMTLCDNDLNDGCPADGVLCLSGLICSLTCTVEETVAPTGYVPGAPQTVTVSGTVTLTFVNTPKTKTCGTICAANGTAGQVLFGNGQNNWFTYITYNKGWGTELSPKTYPIYTGQTKLCGMLYVYDKVVSTGVTHIFVNYVLTAMNGCTVAGLSEYHLQVDKALSDLKKAIVNKSGNPVPGNCEYKGTLDPMQPASDWIEARNDNVTSWTTAYIFAHGIGCYYCP
jgi:hypothetical protein